MISERSPASADILGISPGKKSKRSKRLNQPSKFETNKK